MRARSVLSDTFIGLRRTPIMFVAVVISAWMSLSLLGSGLLVRSQIDTMKGYWYDKVEVSLFLCSQNDVAPPCNGIAATDAQIQQIGQDLRSNPIVKTVYFESQDEALKHVKEQFKDSPDLIANVQASDLQDSYRVKLRDPKRFAVIASAFDGRAGVQSVQDQRALLRNFFSVLNVFQIIALFVALAVIAVATILIVNTVLVSAYSRRREIGIMRLVGASNLYIQLPFLLEGVLAGLLGGALALGTMLLVKGVLINRYLEPKITLVPFTSWGTVVEIGLTVGALGVVISGVAAFLTLSLSKAVRV